MLIGFHGKARSGKDTAADVLVNKFDFTRYGLADPIKQGAAAMFGWNEEHGYGDLKEVVDPFYQFSPRKVYQLLGTEFGREMLRDDIWLKVAEKFVKGNKHTVISDIRFENEAEWVRQQGGLVIRIVRDGLDTVGIEGHASEAVLKPDLRDTVVFNINSLRYFEDQVEMLMNEVIQN